LQARPRKKSRKQDLSASTRLAISPASISATDAGLRHDDPLVVGQDGVASLGLTPVLTSAGRQQGSDDGERIIDAGRKNRLAVVSDASPPMARRRRFRRVIFAPEPHHEDAVVIGSKHLDSAGHSEWSKALFGRFSAECFGDPARTIVANDQQSNAVGIGWPSLANCQRITTPSREKQGSPFGIRPCARS
jgi:hypothetical protein